MEQKNNTLLEMGVYDDGPYEVGDEHLLNPELVPLPANSYLGECLTTKYIFEPHLYPADFTRLDFDSWAFLCGQYFFPMSLR